MIAGVPWHVLVIAVGSISILLTLVVASLLGALSAQDDSWRSRPPRSTPTPGRDRHLPKGA